jgi:hypothetical protein
MAEFANTAENAGISPNFSSKNVLGYIEPTPVIGFVFKDKVHVGFIKRF